MSIIIEQSDEWDEFLIDYRNGNVRRCPDGTLAPY